jgi:hypothetical protein
VFAVKGKKITKLEVFGDGIESYKILENKDSITLQTAAFVDSVYYPVFNIPVECTDASCKMGKLTCANEKIPTKETKGIQALAQSYVSGDKKNEAVDENVIDRFFFAAMYGDADALKVLERNPGFNLDGASAESYSLYSRMLHKVKKLGCKLH